VNICVPELTVIAMSWTQIAAFCAPALLAISSSGPDGHHQDRAAIRPAPGQCHVAMCSASRHVGGAASAACNQARIEASAVVPSHCRIAARSADGTAHTVRTGCGIADP
jgi:hypothetical protein